MHIVVFPGWYPNRIDYLSGDFIQRHVHAIALYCTVSVLIPVKETLTEGERIVTVEKGNVTEIYYYYPSFSSIKWIDRLLSFIRYNYFCLKGFSQVNKAKKVTLVHLYVLQKNFLLGMLLQTVFYVPYVITECSTFYVDGRFEKLSKIQQWLFRWVFAKSASVHSVSKNLSKILKSKLGLREDPVVIANVVDASHFYYDNDLSSDKVTFVHVSGMTPQKNPEGMLDAFAEVKKVNPNFVLHLVGPIAESLVNKIHDLALSKDIVIWKEREYTEVARIMQQSDVFVLFTRFETFGCVIIEANACGLPVIVSDLEVTRELIEENFNGVFVESENVKDLVDKILFMINHLQQFDPLTISLQTRKKYNYETVGQQFYTWFDLVLFKQGNRLRRTSVKNWK